LNVAIVPFAGKKLGPKDIESRLNEIQVFLFPSKYSFLIFLTHRKYSKL